MIVVDASLASKWMLTEPDSPLAVDFLTRRRSQVCGPDLLFIEVAQAIVRAGNERRLSRADAARTMDKWTDAWRDHIVGRHETTPRRLSAASRIALEVAHPLKDCIYVALAIDLGCELATSDVKFADRARPVYPGIRLLADYYASDAPQA